MSVVELSRKLFTLPNEGYLAVIYSVISLIFVLYSFSAFIFLTIITLTIVFSIKLLRLKFTPRRVLFLSLLTTILGMSSFVISGSFSGSFFLFLAVMHFCSERGFIPAAAVSSIPYLILEPGSIVSILISSALFYLFLKLMEVRIKNSTMREFAERFVKFWLTEEAKYAEEILLRNSEEFEGRVKCLRMNDFRLVSTDFHPGPFRDVGGARLVNLFDLPNTVYIHSPTFHGRDPVSEEDVLRIREALSCDGIELKPMRPFELESENFRVYCLPFDKKRLIFVSGKERIDDFIVESENFVVDCHNANFFGDLEAEEVREIEQLVRKAEVMHSEPSNNVKGAFVKISAETDSISRYVSAVLLDYGSLKYAIVVFDSNNVEPQFREMVERRFSELGFTAIVCSTDNHSKTGIRVKESYRPAGGSKRDKELFEQLLEACKKAEFESVDFRYSESLVRAKVLGSLGDEIEKLSGRAGKYVYLFFVFIFLSWLLAIVSKVIYPCTP